MITDNHENAASVTVVAVSYRTLRCTEHGCRNLGRLLLRYADAGGRPRSHPLLCHAHGRKRLARDKAHAMRGRFRVQAANMVAFRSYQFRPATVEQHRAACGYSNGYGHIYPHEEGRWLLARSGVPNRVER
jgi:hypothetical protein